jgi:hypothetical protein
VPFLILHDDPRIVANAAAAESAFRTDQLLEQQDLREREFDASNFWKGQELGLHQHEGEANRDLQRELGEDRITASQNRLQSTQDAIDQRHQDDLTLRRQALEQRWAAMANRAKGGAAGDRLAYARNRAYFQSRIHKAEAQAEQAQTELKTSFGDRGKRAMAQAKVQQAQSELLKAYDEEANFLHSAPGAEADDVGGATGSGGSGGGVYGDNSLWETQPGDHIDQVPTTQPAPGHVATTPAPRPVYQNHPPLQTPASPTTQPSQAQPPPGEPPLSPEERSRRLRIAYESAKGGAQRANEGLVDTEEADHTERLQSLSDMEGQILERLDVSARLLKAYQAQGNRQEFQKELATARDYQQQLQDVRAEQGQLQGETMAQQPPARAARAQQRAGNQQIIAGADAGLARLDAGPTPPPTQGQAVEQMYQSHNEALDHAQTYAPPSPDELAHLQDRRAAIDTDEQNVRGQLVWLGQQAKIQQALATPASRAQLQQIKRQAQVLNAQLEGLLSSRDEIDATLQAASPAGAAQRADQFGGLYYAPGPQAAAAGQPATNAVSGQPVAPYQQPAMASTSGANFGGGGGQGYAGSSSGADFGGPAPASPAPARSAMQPTLNGQPVKLNLPDGTIVRDKNNPAIRYRVMAGALEPING